MGVLDGLRAGYGDQLQPRPAAERDRSNWVEVCVCGHTTLGHSTAIGGRWLLPDPEPIPVKGTTETGMRIHVADGCTGAMPTRGVELETSTINREARTWTVTHTPTCPCSQMRPVALIDRPNRYWNQRVLADRHPFSTGTRATLTHLSKRKAADPDRGGDPAWAEAEFERRFRWIEKAQRCSISGCKATGDDVLPAYVNGDRDSAMRCSRHRD